MALTEMEKKRVGKMRIVRVFAVAVKLKSSDLDLVSVRNINGGVR